MKQNITIASSLPENFCAEIEAHPGVSEVTRLPGKPWDVPPASDALFTYQSQWKDAPQTAPAGWPGNLKWMQIASAGMDTFPDWAFLVPRVSRAVDVQSPAIAEYVVAAVMAHEKRFFDPPMSGPDDWKEKPIGGVAGKVLGIAGYGSIGKEVARRAEALGMEVVALRRNPAPPAIRSPRFVSGLKELVGEVDHLVICLPKTEETIRSIEAEVLVRARRGLHLINIARGEIVDDTALLAALDEGILSAATLDVTSPEPLPAGHPFWTHPRIRLTPHISGISKETTERMASLLKANIDRFLAGDALVGQV